MRVEFFLSNMTSTLQSMDKSVVQNFKIIYHKEVIFKTINDINEGRFFSINFLQTMRMCYRAW